jgi:hypothetical protein
MPNGVDLVIDSRCSLRQRDTESLNLLISRVGLQQY